MQLFAHFWISWEPAKAGSRWTTELYNGRGIYWQHMAEMEYNECVIMRINVYVTLEWTLFIYRGSSSSHAESRSWVKPYSFGGSLQLHRKLPLNPTHGTFFFFFFLKFGVEDLYRPLHSWIILERQLWAITPDLTNAFMVEWEQIPAASFQNLVESFPRRV